MRQEWLNAYKRQKIEDEVLRILRRSELETITEFSVRSAAASRLGYDLSTLDYRLLVRQLVDSFLFSTAAEILRSNSLDKIRDGTWSSNSADYHRVEKRQPLKRTDVDAPTGAKYEGKIICQLSKQRRVTVHDCAGADVVSIRDFHVHSGNLLPLRGENTGISLTSPQWSTFKKSIPSIEQAIVKLESRLRSEAVTRQTKADTASTVAHSHSASEKSQTETCVSNLASAVPLPGKRKRNQSELDPTSSAADPSEKGQTRATISNLVSNVHPHIKTEETVVDTSDAVNASISQEGIISEKAREAQATSNYQEHIPPSRSEVASENSTLPPVPNQLDRVTPLSFEKSNPAQNDQTEIGASTSVLSFPNQRDSRHTTVIVPPKQFLPIQPARFNGNNYHSWKKQMEIFLNQLGIAYVLSELCPDISFKSEATFEETIGAKTAIQRWISDNHLCHHHILHSLCDTLFQLYSQKSYSAGELWEELKAVYNNDFGTKMSLINKYIHFQMVDGASVLDQVQELHDMADSIIASGTWIEESLHTSVIVSKLPPSFKELRLKLMREESVPLKMLMHLLQVEANTKEANSKKDHVTEPRLNQQHRTNRDETQRVCFRCGMEGHMRSNCPRRKFEPDEKSNSREKGFVSHVGRTDDANKRAGFTRGKEGNVSNNSHDKRFEPFDKYAFRSPCTGSEMDDAAKRN